MAEGDVIIPVSLEPDLQKTQETGEKLGKKLSDTLQKTTKLDLSDSARKTAITAKNLLMTVDKLSEKINARKNTLIPTDPKTFNDAEKNITKYEKELEKLTEKIITLTRAHEELELKTKAAGTARQSKEMNSIQKEIDKYSKLQSKYDTLRTKLLNKFQQENNITNTDTAIQMLLQQSDAYRNAVAEYAKYVAATERLEARLEELRNKNASQFNTEAENKSLENSAKRLEEYGQKLDTTKEKLAEYEAVKASVRQVPYSDTREYLEDTQKLEDAVNKLSMAYVKLESAVTTEGALDDSSNMMIRLSDVAKNATLSIGALATRLLSLAKSSIRSGIRMLSKEMQSLGRHSDSSSISVNKAIKTFIKYTFGVRSFFYLFRKMRSAVIDSIKAMAELRLGNINESLTALKSSLQYLKDSWAAAFAPIIEFVTPALTTLMDVVSNITNKIAALMALLTGKQTYVKAVKQTSALADATQSGADAQKEWNNELYSFDELNRQQDKTDSSSGGGGGITSAFEEAPVEGELPEWLVDWIERLKEAFANQDFSKIGELIAEGLNKALEILNDWIVNVFRPWAVEWAGNLAEILNNVVEHLNWELLGDTVAQGINAIADALNTFLTKFDFEKLGKKFGLALKTMFDRVEWDLIGNTFANKWNALINFIYGVVTTEGLWESIGNAISELVINFFAQVEWKKAGDAFAAGINGVFETLNIAINTIPWVDITVAVTDGLNRAITGVNWKQVGDTFGDIMIALGSMLITALGNIDWAGVGKAIGDFLNHIDWVSVAGLVIGGIMTLAESMIELLVGIIASEVGKVAEVFEELGLDGIAGFFKGVEDALMNLASWLKETMIDPLINGVKEMLGIQSPSTVFAEIGTNVVEGMLQGISNTWEKIKTFFSTALSNLKTSIQTTWNDIKTATSTAWNDIKKLVTDAWNQLKDTLKSISFVDVGTSLVDGIIEGVKDAWHNLVSALQDLCDSAIDTVKSIFDINSPSKVFAKIGENLVFGLEAGISDNADDAVKVTAKMASDIGNVSFELDNLPSSIDGIIDRLLQIQDAFMNISDSILQLGNIPIPAIAMGGVVPSFKSSNMTEMYDNIVSAITTALSQDNNSNISTSQAPAPIKIYIRGKEVFDAMVDENNSAIMRTGISPLVR